MQFCPMIVIHMNTCMHAYINTYTYEVIHTYIHEYIRTYIHTSFSFHPSSDAESYIYIYIYIYIYTTKNILTITNSSDRDSHHAPDLFDCPQPKISGRSALNWPSSAGLECCSGICRTTCIL